MTVYDNLVPMIHAQCGDLASAPNPVMFAFIDTRAPQGTTSMRGASADIARALWEQGLQVLRDIGDAALDPSRQIDAMSRLGLEQGFCPDLTLLVFQFWSAHEMRDGRLQKSHSYEPRVGAPHRLQVELRAHGRAPVIFEWKVSQRDGNVCAVPPPPRHFVGPGDLRPPRLPTDEEIAASARLRDEDIRRAIEEGKLASMQLPTFVVRPPPLRAFTKGMAWVHLGDSRHVTFQAGDSLATKDDWGNSLGHVRLQAVNGLVVPNFYDSGIESDEIIWPIDTMLVVYRPYEGPDFRIVVIQPSKVVSSGP
jgi:hypothetical protein